MRSFKTILLCASALGLLAGCGSSSTARQDAHVSGSRIDAALQRAADKTSNRDSLPFLETIYKRNQGDYNAALSFAQALRHAGDAQNAALILAPFIVRDDSASVITTEYAAIQLVLGNYIAAEDFAAQAIADNGKNAEAYHYLAIAQDARERHAEAEDSFRAALKHWAGDPVPVLNNLALNLATQRRVDEAAEVIARAAALAPDRRDVESNRQLINELLKVNVAMPPKPSAKPA